MEQLQKTAARGGKRSWALTALLGGVVLLTVAGLALLAVYFYLSRQTAAETHWINPQRLVAAEAVAPDLAVLTLAGESDERVLRAALDAGEVETAYATLTYSVLLPDSLRSGSWLLLAERYRTSQPERALACYGAALDGATLSSTLGDQARADISLQVARNLATLERKPAARLALAQAENLARYSVTLLPAQRRDLLVQVAAAYAAMGEAQTAQAIRKQFDTASAGPLVTLEQPPPFLPQLRGSVTLSGNVVAAIAARQQAAANLAARWLGATSVTRAGLTDALGQALLAEDAARSAFYASVGSLSEADSLAVLHDQVAWLTVKYRAAQGAFGAALTPAWQGQGESIRNDLVGAYTALINGYGRRLDALPPAESSQARVELLRQALLWTRLGLFPDEVEDPLREQLVEAAQALWTRQGGAGLTVTMQEAQGWRLYLLAGAEPAKATPTSK